jgi:phosphohistidine phosphatase
VAHTLVLLRHAKAADQGVTDAARPLAPRGLRDAAAAGRWLAGHSLVPDHAIVSDAVRAVQTWQAAAAELTPSPPVTVDPRIYENTVEAVLAVLHDAPETAGTVLLVGHNPTMQDLVLALEDSNGDDRALDDVRHGFPTAGIAVLQVEGTWADLEPGGATLRELAVPIS